MRAVVISLHIVSVVLTSSGGGLLTLFPCSSMGSHPQAAVLHELLQRESFPWSVFLHKLLQCGSLPWGADIQDWFSKEVLPLSVMGSALASSGSISEPGGTGTIRHRGSF